MARKRWAVWVWDDRNRSWLEVGQDMTETDAKASVEHRRAFSEKENISGAWVAMPHGEKPRYIPEGEPDAVIFDAEDEPESAPEPPPRTRSEQLAAAQSNPTERSRREHLRDEGGEVVDLVTEAYWRGWLDARNAAKAAISGGATMPTVTGATRAYLAEQLTRLHVSGGAYDIASEENPS
jgi:hypothetical protein